MKVQELIKELKKFDQEAEVVYVKDWDCVEDGILTDRYPLVSLCNQNVIVDQGLEFVDYEEVILEFSNERL